MSQILQSKIAAVRHKHVTVSLFTGLSAALGVLALLLGVGMLLDWWLDLPRVVRAVFLAVDLSLLVCIVVGLIVIPILYGPDDEAVARRVEDYEPALKTRLIASVQLSRPGAVPAGASVSMVRAMVAQTELMAGNLDFGRVIETGRMAKFSVAAGVLLLLGITGYAWGHNSGISTDLLKRALLANIDVPRKTRIILGDTPDMTVPRGETVTLAARAAGLIPDHGEADVIFENGKEQTFSLDKKGADTFSRDLESVEESFRYRLRLGDNRTGWHKVTVLTRPVVTTIDVQQAFPAYTHMGTLPRSLGDLSILAGSHLKVRVTSNNPCNSTAKNKGHPSVIRVTGSDVLVPMQVDAKDPRLLTADVEIPDNANGFAINLVDENGMSSAGNAAVYPIKVVPDKDPVVRITYPVNREELATKVARLVIGFDATDDFGISKLLLMYKVDEGTPQSIPLDITGQPKTVRNRFEWSLTKLGAVPTTRSSIEGSSIEFWVEAVDNNNVRKSGPGIGDSEHYALRIVTEEVKRAELAARMEGHIETIRTGIEDQQNLSDRLGAFVKEKKKP